MATKKPTNERKSYTVLVPFSWRGHWTTENQELELLDCEAQALLIASKVKLTGSK